MGHYYKDIIIHLLYILGEFGIVYRGQINKVVGGKTWPEIVAVKTLKGIIIHSFGIMILTIKATLTQRRIL